MNHKLKIFILFIITSIISGLVAKNVGRLYEIIIGRRIYGDWINTCPECWYGFIIIFTFLAGLLFFGFLDKNRLNITLVFMLLMPVLNAITGGLEVGLISLGFGIVGLGLGQIIYLIRKKYRKKITT